MTTKGKVWDIVKPKDNWGRNYAHMEYQRIVDHDLWQPTTYIEVETCTHKNQRTIHAEHETYWECLDCHEGGEL